MCREGKYENYESSKWNQFLNIGDNVDTDVIIPARYLNSSDPERTGYTLYGGY